jgi:hypothetical protein
MIEASSESPNLTGHSAKANHASVQARIGKNESEATLTHLNFTRNSPRTPPAPALHRENRL